jgi:hypothetical protein
MPTTTAIIFTTMTRLIPLIRRVLTAKIGHFRAVENPGTFMDFLLRASTVPRQRGILSSVPTKPFATNYRIPIAQGFIVINGEQVTKIEAIRQIDAFGLSLSPEAWTLTFYLSDGNKHEIRPSEWTANFVNEVFKRDW